MQSKTSFFNKALYVKTVMRCWPLWAFASFVAALVPFATLITGRIGFFESAYDSTLISKRNLLEIATGELPVLIFIYAVICAMTVWNYLFTARSVGMYHSLPVKRENLFVTNVLAGMTIMLIPIVIACILEPISEFLVGGIAGSALFIIVGVAVGESLLFFGFATLMAFCTGHIVTLPVFYVLFSFIAVFFETILEFIATGFIFGINTSHLSLLEILSPLVYIMINVKTVCKYANDGNYLVSVDFVGGHIVVIYALVGLVMLACAMLLYKKRNSEVAGDFSAFKAVENIIHVLGTAAYTLGMGTVIYGIYDVNGNGYYKALPFLICMLVAYIMGYYFIRMILEKTIRVFNKKSSIAAIIGALIVIAAVAGFEFDFFGIETRIPDLNKVESVSVTSGFTSNNYVSFNQIGEKDNFDMVVDFHKAAIENRDRYVELISTGNGRTDFYGCFYVTIVYHMKDGSVFTRAYPIPHCPETLQDECMVIANKLANTRQSVLYRYGIVENGVIRDGAIEAVNLYENLSTTQGKAIMEAVMRDIDAGNIPEYSIFETDTSKDYAITVYLTAESEYADAYSYFTLTEDMTNTIDTILKLGILTKDDLIKADDYYEYDEKFIYQ